MKALVVLMAALAAVMSAGVRGADYAAISVPMKLERVTDDVYYVSGLPRAATENEGFVSNAGFVITGEGVVVFQDQRPQIRRDRIDVLESSCPGRPIFVFQRDICTLGKVLEPVVETQRKDIPASALIADEDHVLRTVQGGVIRVFHLALGIQLIVFTGERLKHFDVKKRG